VIMGIRQRWSKLNRFQRSALVVIFFLLLLFFVCLPLWIDSENVSLRVEYSGVGGYETEISAQCYWDVGSGYSEENACFEQTINKCVRFELQCDVSEMNSLRIDPAIEAGRFKISSMQVLNHGIVVNNIPVRDVLERAVFYNVDSVRIEKAGLVIESLSTDPIIELNKEFVEDYFGNINGRLGCMMSAWALGIFVLLVASIICIHKIVSVIEAVCMHIDNIMRVLLLIVACLVGFMAFNSFDYSHPDENVSKSAVDYYVDNWAPADIRMPEAADSFSEYGYSRLSEETVYYFLAGKVAWVGENILGFAKYYRLFNVCLFLGLVALCFKKGKTNRYLYMLVGMTPQIWYLFSYCTSDAWDYFLMVVIMYQILSKESMLRKALCLQKYKWRIVSLGLVGIMFGALYLGKNNYLSVFLLAFLVLLKRLCEGSKVERRRLVLCCLSIIIVFGAWVIGTKLITEIRYDLSFSEVKYEMHQKYAWDAFKKNEDGTREYAGLNMREKGVSLEQLFTKYEFGEETIKSYAGYYGWMEYPGGNGYYRLFYGCYFAIAILWTVSILKSKRDVGSYLYLIAVNSIIAILFGASVWHSWTGDFQPQGRYLLPMNAVCAADAIEVQSESKQKKWAGTIQVILIILGVYSFVKYGIVMLT